MSKVIPLFGNAPTQPTTPTPPKTSPDPQLVLYDGQLVIHKRGDNDTKWHYRLRLPSGDYERKTTGKRDLAEARKVAEARYHEVTWRHERGFSAKAVQFKQAAEEYIAHIRREGQLGKRAASKSKRAERKAGLITRYLLPYFGERNLDSITALDVRKFHEWYLDQWQANSPTKRTVMRTRDNKGRDYKKPIAVTMPWAFIRKPGVNSRIQYEQLIRGIVDLAATNGHITKEERVDFEATRGERGRRGGFTVDEEAQLVALLEARITACPHSHFQASRRLLWLYVRFLLLTGLRPGSEASTLRFQDIVLKEGPPEHYVVHVREGKTGSRDVVADKALGDVLAGIRAQHPDPQPGAKLWIKPNGEETNRFAEPFITVLQQAGLKQDREGQERSLYSLRHTYITRRLERGVDLTLVAKNSGTSVQQIENHCNHVLHTSHAAKLLK